MEMSIEQIYQKKTQLEHILLRPDTYIGSTEFIIEQMWIFDFQQNKMIQKNIKYVPGLYKIFDEILVNASDNKQRDKHMDTIKIKINKKTNTISIWNNGKGIPIVIHKEENLYIPTMIFGHLLTSSNYNDNQEKITGGRNGYGAKLCNIFSSKFTIETACKTTKKYFKQSWSDNMSKVSNILIKDNYTEEDFTNIIFTPDLTKFKMSCLDDDIISLMQKRIFDIAGSIKNVNIYLNNFKIPINKFEDYIKLYTENNPILYEKCNDYWEIGISLSENGFQQVSFVNSISTIKGGSHVNYISDIIIKELMEILEKKNKSGIQIKPFQIKNHLWIFVNCLIYNPTFDSQTKENMTLQIKNFKIKCDISNKFFKNILKIGIVDSILSWAKFKADSQLQKLGNKTKIKKIQGIHKLEDAFNAGTKKSIDCSLILTEGDSAKSMAVSGLASIGRDNYGIFPLKGKILNVREASYSQIFNNVEINNIIKIIGLQYKKKYETIDDLKTLRYGKIIIMTDQDQDGSHIKGLLINFIHSNWPTLLKLNFIEEFITPIVKISKKFQIISFFSIPEFEKWKNNNSEHTYKVKYYKGLGTSTSKEAKEYFENMSRHKIKFVYTGDQDDKNIIMAFSKKCANERKEWLTNYMNNTNQKYLYENNDSVSYSDFINLELVLFSNYDNIRSIPNMIDGLKPGQRKIIYTCLKRNDKKEIKVAQLSGSVAEQSAYHHGEVSLMTTIINLAQNFVGSNNINLLLPIGQFGTRLCGGKDAASPRYIFTLLNSITKYIFNKYDENLLNYEYDDNQQIEPKYYIPIIPMILINGADGIGTGWMTKIPNYNPYDIINNLILIMDNKEPIDMHPYYKNFKGIIEKKDDKYIFTGIYKIINTDIMEITELPIHMWTQNYKEIVLEQLLISNIIKEYKEYNTDTIIHYIIIFPLNKLSTYNHNDIIKLFKLQTSISMTSMCAFNHKLILKKYNNVIEILKEFYHIRLLMYTKRKEYLIKVLQNELNKISNQVRFIIEKCDGTLIVENKKKQDMINELLERKYDPNPDYDYLLSMPILSLTIEKKESLIKLKNEKILSLETLTKKTPIKLWKEDLKELILHLQNIEKQEYIEELNLNKNIKKPPLKYYAI